MAKFQDQQHATGNTAAVAGLWRTFARAGPKAVAESLTSHELERLHIDSGLDRLLTNWVRSGVSVVLTGNAGDGKTHLLERAKASLRESGAVVIQDATASARDGDFSSIIRQWQDAISEDRPICIAANEFPLYQLRRAGCDFAPLAEVDRQCRHRLSYGEHSEDEGFREQVVVVDLSLRNPLAPGFWGLAIDRLLSDVVASQELDPTAAHNVTRLKHPRVQQRLRKLIDQLVARGARTTVRELWIFLARLVFGARESMDVQVEDWYSELVFTQDPRFPLTQIVADVDPAWVSHPRIDLAIEDRHPALRAGWAIGEPAMPPHPQLSRSQFSALKRAFYFEHERGDEADVLRDPAAIEFQRLLTSDDRDDGLVVRLVKAVNAAYCPVEFQGRDSHLFLWSGHRFHEQPSRSFLASERLPVEDFVVERPRLPHRVDGAFDYKPDHLALTAARVPGRPRLILDFELFRTLERLRRGLPRKLIPERDVHRLDAFVERLGAARAGRVGRIWSVHLEHREVIEVVISGDLGRYEEVKVHG